MTSAAARPINRRELIVGGALAATAAAGIILTKATEFQPQRIDPLEKIIPARLGVWAQSPLGDLRLPRGENPEDGFYDQVLTRYYTSTTSLPIMLLIAYGGSQSGDTSIHRPEMCYPAAGFALGGSATVAIPVSEGSPITARQITARAPGRTEQILYWSRIGTDYPTTNFEQRKLLLQNALAGRALDGALVRISTIDPDLSEALPTLLAFAESLLHIGDPRARALLTGNR